MQIHSETLGPFSTNCYILDFPSSHKNQEFYAIDAPWQALSFISSHAQKTGKTLSKLFLTHSHQDHIADTAAVMNAFPNLKVYISKIELPYLLNPGSDGLPIAMEFEPVNKKQESRIIPISIVAPPVTAFHLKETDHTLPSLWHCPGHSKGSLCYYFPNYKTLFSGDTLMHGTCGRIDLPGGSKKEMISTLRSMLHSFPGNTFVYPGHGPETTIATEAPWIHSIDQML